ncbi:uncharacterized protein ttc6 isoform X3 [Oncorhynchus kisutch]|uniref:uncharacterized protein ttc6 isoform X3 n=1 Tax=Oncorhynchus kisutch TaxID=8019 RepID=UPI0012DC424F|nr:tetratricopeptide repeat protein 6 isoform X3 [Oncorhynchus kisutch]
MKQLFFNSHTTTSTQDQPPDSLHTLESSGLMEEATEGPCGTSDTPQNRTSQMSAGSVSLLEFHADLLQSPPASLPQSALLLDIPKTKSEVSRSQGTTRIKGISEGRNSVHLVLSSPGQKPSQKPAIAQLAGTTKVVSMSMRPQPPSKPRSERPATGTRMFIYKSKKESEQVSKKEAAERRIRRSNFFSRCLALSSDNTDDSRNSEDSGSEPSHGKAPQKVKKKKRRNQKDRSTHAPRTPTDDRSSKSQRSTMAPNSIHSVKSTTELLEEARGIVGPEVAESQEDTDPQQRHPEESVATTMGLVRGRGRTVDEIIASLQRGDSDMPSASDQMIKELMERVLGDSYNAENEEEKTVESEEREENISHVPTEDTPQRSPVSQRMLWVKRDSPTPPRPAESPKVTSGVYKIAHSLSERETDGDDSMVSALPQKVTYADVMTARGDTIAPSQRPARVSLQNKTIQGLSPLATWAPKAHADGYKTIHHLCTTPVSQALPLELQLASRVCHTSSQLSAPPQFHQQRAALQHIAAQPDRHRILNEGVPREEVIESDGKDCVSHLPSQTSDSLADWQRIAEFYVEKPRMMLHGQATSLCSNELKMFWHPAPPKFSCSPAFVKHKLFPKYQATRNDLSREELYGDLQDLVESACDLTEMEPTTSVENVLSRKFKSMIDLRVSEQSPQPSIDEGQLKRPFSAPHLNPEPEAFLKVSCDFATVTRELEVVRQQLSSTVLAEETHPQVTPTVQQEADHQAPAAGPNTEELTPALSQSQLQYRRDRGRVMMAEPVRGGSISHSKRKVAKGGKKLCPAKLAYIHEKLQEPPRTLIRSESVCQLLPIKPTTCLSEEPPLPLPLPRYPSLPLVLDFESFASDQGGIPDVLPPREWVRDIWDAWFDQLFPPLEESSSTSKKESDSSKRAPSSSLQSGALKKPGEKVLMLDEIQPLDWVDLSLTLDQGLTTGDLEGEVAKLTQAIAQQDRPSAFDLCRRGALQKKLGRLNQALEDLNAAISLEPYLLDAYWHRHSIYLLRNNQNSALDDLNFIIKHTKKHADAFKSKAEIYRVRGETTLAIINYTQAIKCRPEDDDNYFKRAEMYEKRNEILLAMEDYAKTFTINPGRTDALLTHGLQYFHSCNWMVALSDFTLLLQRDPSHAIARTYRGRIYAKVGQYQEAIEDFSLAVHLDPNDWLAFYHRGCLLRKRMPDISLQDLSTSVLINDSQENLSAFLHRGLLYTERRQWQQAVFDFEAVIKLDRSVALAHVNLGLIFMLNMGQNYEAIRMFSNALRVDPTYIRGYICRAQAYRNVNDLKRALKDLTRATHMKPDAQQLYIMRGQYLCDMEQFDLATFCIQYAAEMNKALGSSPIQQAAVQSFLGNDAKAIACLEAASNNRSSPPILILLGKTQMKARKFMEAVESFRKALILLSPNETNLYNVSEAAEVFYLTGLCYMALALLLQVYKGAVEDLTMALRIDKTCSFAHYNRGVCYQQLKEYELALRDYGIVLLLPSKKEIDLKVLINRALLYVELSDHHNALQDFKAASLRSPEDATIYHALGVYHHRLGQLQESVEAYSQAMQISPFFLDAYVGRGNACMDYGHTHATKQAQRDFLSALHLNPLCSNARICLAYNFQVFGFFQRAWNQFTVAAEIDSKCWKAFEGRAVINLQMGNTYAAFQDINMALKHHPVSDQLLTNRGVINQFMGDKANAMKDYQRAISLNPKYALAFFNAANLYFYNRQFEQACEHYSQAFELDPEDESAVLNRAITRALLRKVPEALQDFSEALRLNPYSSHVFFNRANLYSSLRQYRNAEKDLSQALLLQPNDALVYKLRADVRGHLGLTDQAMQDYRTAVELQEALEG